MLTSASQLARAMACPASVLLPQSDEITTAAAERGTAVHQMAEALQARLEELDDLDFDVLVEDVLSSVPEKYRPLCEAIPWDALPRGMSAEVPYAYDIVTRASRWLKKTTHRDYSDVGATEIAGTIDLVGAGATSVYVGDIKTGWYDLGPPDKAPQLLLAALAATQLLDRPRAELQWVRLREGYAHRPMAVVDVFDLAAFAAKLRGWFEQLQRMKNANANPEDVGTVAGEHCHFCPALPSCPRSRQQALVLANGTLRDQVEQWPLPSESPLQRLRQFRFCKTVVDYMSRRIYAEAKETPIDLTNGKLFGEHTSPGNERLDGQIAMGVLLEMVPDVAQICAKFIVSKASIRRGLKGQKRGLHPKIIKAIREAGGATKKPKTTIEEYDSET